jgi:hypothetical protein
MIAHAARSSASAANWTALIKSSDIKVSVQPRTDCVELFHDLLANNALYGQKQKWLAHWTAASTVQCIYSSVSKASLQKTGVLLNSAGDFREFSPKKFENGAVGDFQQLEKPAIGGPFCYQRRKFSETWNAWLE